MTDHLYCAAQFHRRGWVFLPRFQDSWTTLRVAESLGAVMSFDGLTGYESIPVVQRLSPKPHDAARRTVYSGTYGIGEFPLHTDLAHWYRPPRYFLLRCVRGDRNVGTRLLDGHIAMSRTGAGHYRRALFHPRRALNGVRPLLRARQTFEDGAALRWDDLFLKPANRAAQILVDAFANSDVRQQAEVKVLSEKGDAVLVDNWRVFHGRTAAASGARLLERVYLTSLRNPV